MSVQRLTNLRFERQWCIRKGTVMYIRDSKKLRRYWDNILSRVYLLAKTYNCLSTRIAPDAEIAPLVEMPFTLADFDSGRRYVSWFSGPKAQDLAMSLCIDDTGGAESTELKCLPGAGRGIHAFWRVFVGTKIWWRCASDGIADIGVVRLRFVYGNTK